MNEDMIIKFGTTEIDLSSFVDNSPDYQVKEPLLESVVFELTHDPHFEAMSKKHKIIKLLQDQTLKKHYYTGNNSLDDGLQLFLTDGYVFQPECQRTSLICSNYQSFAKFKEKVENIFEQYNKILPFPEIGRIGLRYINKITVDPKDALNIEKMFNLTLRLAEKNIAFGNLSFVHSLENGLFAKSQFMPFYQKEQTSLNWDNDVFIFFETNFKKALKSLPVFHQAATKLFLNFLSDEAKDKYIEMRGEKE